MHGLNEGHIAPATLTEFSFPHSTFSHVFQICWIFRFANLRPIRWSVQNFVHAVLADETKAVLSKHVQYLLRPARIESQQTKFPSNLYYKKSHLWDLGPISLTIFARNSNLMKIMSFNYCPPDSNNVALATTQLSCHWYAKFCSNHTHW